MARHSDATDWFEELYANRDIHSIPWAQLKPNAFLTDWLDGQAGEGRRALVVGCGLGDDAEALAAHGCQTTAFDIAPSAIRTARERFPDSKVEYVVADLFEAPQAWHRAFDLVFESITVQALPPHLQPKAAANIAQFGAPGGTLLVGTMLRSPQMTPNGPPWPLDPQTLTEYTAAGFTEVDRRETTLNRAPHVWGAHIVYRRDGQV